MDRGIYRIEMAERSGRDGRNGGTTYRVLNSTGVEYVVELPSGGTAGQVKAQLSQRMGIPASGMILLFAGDELADNTSLESAYVTTSVPLNLDFRTTSLVNTVQVSVELPSGRTVRIAVPEDANEDALKRELEAKAQVKFGTVRLTLNQESLGPNTRAQDLGGEMLHAVAQLDGGSKE